MKPRAVGHPGNGPVFLINVPIAALGIACALPLMPDSKNLAARSPGVAGALMSIALGTWPHRR